MIFTKKFYRSYPRLFIVLFAISLALSIISTYNKHNPKVTEAVADLYKVIRVVDGDTIELESGQKLRYIGIDTPESTTEHECFGVEAKEKNRELVEGKLVRLEKDVSETDRYGRLLRYVYLIPEGSNNEIFVNEVLVNEGFANAISYPPDIKYQEKFLLAQREAREGSRGLWNRCIDTSTNSSDVKGSSIVFQDKDCADFKTQKEAQDFFESIGEGDPHKLDADGDGRVCISLP